ncbi:MAG: response regulator [candidate division Zixibacteria bacterium]|nr:response regulator [candidate division Zixibacteria bacterium]MDD5426445.1 response regulator [candidate division Zixibacteria bacterium]
MANPAEKTILVVDDEEDVRNFLTLALTEAGFKVRTAADGFEALEAVKKQIPDLISLDLVMPKKSGAKFHRELVKNKAWARIPIIIVTGHARDDLGKADLKELTMSGPGIYLEKPVKPESYVAAVKGLLNIESRGEEKKPADQVKLQNDLKNLIDEADPDTLKRLKELLNKKK